MKSKNDSVKRMTKSQRDRYLIDQNGDFTDLPGGSRQGLVECLEANGISFDDIPVVKDLDRQILAAVAENPKSLDMSDCHCGTSHCRAGWAVVLGGAKALEKKMWLGDPTAEIGAAIYMKSCPDLPIPDFYADNNEALLDMFSRAAGNGPTDATVLYEGGGAGE